MPSGTESPVPRAAPQRSPLTFEDLTADLVWPRLLKAAGLALAPARIGLCLFFLAAIAVLIDLTGHIDGAEGNALRDSLERWWASVTGAIAAALQGRWNAASSLLHTAYSLEPAALLHRSWWTALFLLPIALALLSIVAGAVGRSAACEFTNGSRQRWTESLAFALDRWKSLLGAVLAPLLLVWFIALGLALAGGMLLTLPVVNIFGAILYGGALLLGAAAALVIIAYVPGSLLLAPAVACEGADAIDAVQRAYSYVLARPARLAWYVLVLFAQAVVVLVIAAIIAALAIRFTESAAGAWLGPRGAAVVNHEFPIADGLVEQGPPGATEAAPLSGSWRASGRIVRIWSALPGALVAAYALSLLFTGSTLLYLAMRRVCDGEDMDEIWMPGMVEGTMAQSLGERSAASAGAPAPADSISESGPADET